MKQLDYQTAMQRLEKIADLLEEGNLPLEESLKVFEEGAGLAKQLRKMLKEAEQKLKILHLQEGSDV